VTELGTGLQLPVAKRRKLLARTNKTANTGRSRGKENKSKLLTTERCYWGFATWELTVMHAFPWDCHSGGCCKA